MERFELNQEKVNHQDLLTLAVNPNELTYGNSHFLWGLRNTYNTDQQVHGHEVDTYDNLGGKTGAYKTSDLPPKPQTAATVATLDSYKRPPVKRVNLAMSSAGSHVTAFHVKKVPDHQTLAVAKVKPFSLLSKERFSAT